MSRHAKLNRKTADPSTRVIADPLEPRRLLSHPIFHIPAIYDAGSNVSSLISADFNGDGKMDLASANSTDNNVSVLLNIGHGSFSPRTNYLAGQGPSSLTAVDVNRDHKLDLVVTNADSNSVSVLLNKGRGRFAAKVDYVTGAQPVSVTAADFNGDGKPDLAVANASDESLRLLFNKGNGTFGQSVDYSTDGSPAVLASGDFNHDGKMDLAVTVESFNLGEHYFMRILLNTGHGAFAASADYPTETGPEQLIAADLDGNRSTDLVVGSRYGYLDVFLNNGNGTFAPRADYPTNIPSTPIYAPRIAAGDFNGDGKIDIAANSQVDYVFNPGTLILNNGKGTFGTPIEYPFGAAPFSVMTAADFNGDGRTDLAWANGSTDYGAPQIGVLLNHGPSPFAVKSDYTGDLTRPSGVLAADFNGDGRLDILVSSTTVGPYLFTNNIDGTFSSSHLSNVGDFVLAIADFNGDGSPDLVVGRGDLGVQLNNGDGAFGSVTSYLPNNGYYAPAFYVAVGDFNGDGKLDIAANHLGDATINILLNNGDGTFAAGAQYAGSGPLIAADLNGDGKMDLAVSTSTGVQILRGNGNGTFIAGDKYAVGSGSMITGDFDGDGRIDLAVSTNSGLVMLWGNRRGKFSPETILASAGNLGSLAAADFNGDGRLDIATTGMVFRNKGKGKFAHPLGFATGRNSESVISADFNGDGKPDLAWANFYNNSFSVMLNQ